MPLSFFIILVSYYLCHYMNIFTYQLNGSHVLLPPEKLLEAWSSSRQAIVGIHDDVNKRVHHGMEGAHSTWGNQSSMSVKTSTSLNTYQQPLPSL